MHQTRAEDALEISVQLRSNQYQYFFSNYVNLHEDQNCVRLYVNLVSIHTYSICSLVNYVASLLITLGCKFTKQAQTVIISSM